MKFLTIVDLIADFTFDWMNSNKAWMYVLLINSWHVAKIQKIFSMKTLFSMRRGWQKVWGLGPLQNKLLSYSFLFYFLKKLLFYFFFLKNTFRERMQIKRKQNYKFSNCFIYNIKKRIYIYIQKYHTTY